VRRLTAATLLLVMAASPPAAAALEAGAASVVIALPAGTPLAGYGGFPRRAWVPDLLGRRAYAFWFRPSTGVHDPIRVRALWLASGATRILWLAVDTVGVDPALVAELRQRLAPRGPAPTMVLSASHTHSGPGAYSESALFGFVALDRLVPEVRDRLLDGMEAAAREAERRREPARASTGLTTVPGVGRSRLGQPLDPELGVLKITGARGRPIALLWSYAVHGTALGRGNFLLSGDLMAEASARLERETGTPALFVNGAAGDVSPLRHGWGGVEGAGAALADGALALWRGMGEGGEVPLASQAIRVRLPKPALSLHNCLAGWAPRFARIGLGSALPPSSELLALRIGDGAWVTVPGELQTRLGLDIKKAGRRHFAQVFVAGYSNDYLGYFLTREDYAKPSYIACGTLYGERGGEILRDAATELLERLATAESRS
jgi:neutral/alkaline ceramidase-like enzyme